MGILNNQDNYTKNHNYWKSLEAKLKCEVNQLVSATTQLNWKAPENILVI